MSWAHHVPNTTPYVRPVCSSQHRGARLLQVEAVVHIVRAHVALDVREVLVQRPHGAVVGAGRVQRDDGAGRAVRAQAVQHGRAARVAKVHRQVQRLAGLRAGERIELM